MTNAGAPERTEEVAAGVRDARTRGTPLRIVAGGTWLDAGRPSSATGRLALHALRGITEFEPDDFTLTARAGTPLAEIGEVAARAGRWLTLQPFGRPESTIGATVATASWGPLASAFGTPRDHVLGCAIVTGRGEIVHAGGRVVKNVAGFDLVRLATGSWGTLGVITEVTMRLRALPEIDRTLAVAPGHGEAASLAAIWRWLRESPFTPLAAELCSPALAAKLGVGDEAIVLVRLGGNEPLVRAAERSVGELGATREVDAGVWERLRVAEPEGSTTVRLGTLPASVGPVWTRASHAAERAGGWAHATLARGVVRCIVPPRPASERDEEFAHLRGIMGEPPSPGSRIVERAPSWLWPEISPTAADPLSAGVRRAFDPDALLNPGILAPIA